MTLKCSWLPGKVVKGLLLDITGVLYESGKDGGTPIKGSVEAMAMLRSAGVRMKLVSNETQTSRVGIVKKLRRHGFDVCVDDIMTPCPAVVQILQERNLRPHLLVHPDALSEFDSLPKDDPNCVVIGDAAHHFTYEALNAAFRVLIQRDQKFLFSLGKGKFYQEDGLLTLDVGPYAAALEYACGATAEIIGKPNPSYFLSSLKCLNLEPSEVAMIGDDIESDVGGAQAVGLTGILVRTGKYRPANESHPKIKPDGIVDNLAAAVKLFLDE